MPEAGRLHCVPVTDAPALPARVRLSRLPGTPGPALLAQLQRLADTAGQPAVGARLADLSPQAACWVALAGGRPVALLLAEASGLQLAVDSGWRGRGLEEALERAARAAS